jgi:hypothetical protein
MARRAADTGDAGTNDLLVSDVIRSNELQVWFIAEHVVDVPLARAISRASKPSRASRRSSLSKATDDSSGSDGVRIGQAMWKRTISVTCSS